MSGKTTKQMRAAPRFAIFVWCSDHVNYPHDLARHLQREDLLIFPASRLNRDRIRMMMSNPPKKPIVIDHALVVTPEIRSVIYELSQRFDIIQEKDLE